MIFDSFTIESFEHNDHTIKICQDEDPPNPRENDNLGVLVCFHRRHMLGDKKHGYRPEDFDGWGKVREQIERDHAPVVILPLSLLDHSGLHMYVGAGAHPCDPGGWDSGQIGWAYVSRKAVVKEYGCTRTGKRIRERAEECLRAEIEEYDQYLSGDGYVIENATGNQVDSCWGFFGLEYRK